MFLKEKYYGLITPKYRINNQSHYTTCSSKQSYHKPLGQKRSLNNSHGSGLNYYPQYLLSTLIIKLKHLNTTRRSCFKQLYFETLDNCKCSALFELKRTVLKLCFVCGKMCQICMLFKACFCGFGDFCLIKFK